MTLAYIISILYFQYIISYFFAFILYSFYKIVKLKFLLDTTSFKRVLKVFTYLEMPVNIIQYRRSVVGIFNNRNFVFRSNSQTLYETSVRVQITCISNYVFRYFQ